MEEEIDLRKYIDVLVKHWKLIVSITVIAVLVAGLVSFLTPPTYEARANMLITTKTQPEIVFVPEYRSSSIEYRDLQWQTLVALVKSSTVVSSTISKLGDKLEPGERSMGSILNKVQVGQDGDIIEISVRDSDPEKAAAIANAWVDSYQMYVNNLYSGISPLAENIQAQADVAREDYEGKQKTYENFISDSRIDELGRRIADRELLYKVKLLREQVKPDASSPASAAANSLAFILLQASASASLPSGFQVSLDSLSEVKVSLYDIEALINTLETRSGGAQGQSINELQQEINRLKAKLEQESARKLELRDSRDTARSAYTTVSGKVVEAKVAARAQSTVVHSVGTASVPEKPMATHRAMNIGIALVLGLIVGVFAAFGIEYFKKTGEKSEGD